MKTTAEFREQSAAHKALQTQNTHPHRLGTAGYAGKTAQWAAEDENETRPFAEITDERSLLVKSEGISHVFGRNLFHKPGRPGGGQTCGKYVELPSC